MKPILLLSLLALAGASAEPSCCQKTEAAAEQGSASLYQLASKWTNQHGKEVTLASLKGKPVLVTMGYASCQYACPRLIADFMAIERALTEAERSQVSFVFVSIDPERDTPEKLKAFLGQYHVDQDRWSALRGTDDGILELSVALGNRYRKLENSDFAHSNLITLLSSDGEIVHRQEGLGTDPTDTVAALRELFKTATNSDKQP